MPPDGDPKSKQFNSYAAYQKRGAHLYVRKKNEGGKREKETGWQYQQSGKLHGHSFPKVARGKKVSLGQAV